MIGLRPPLVAVLRARLLVALLSLPLVPAPLSLDISVLGDLDALSQADVKARRATVFVQVSSRLLQVRATPAARPDGHRVELLQVTANDVNRGSDTDDVTAAFVINLDSRPDRWSRMVRRLSPLNATAGRVSANRPVLFATRSVATNASTDTIPASTVALSWLTERNSEYAHMGLLGYAGLELNLSDGERGCAMSHVRIWREIASGADDKRPVLILEDDAVLSPDFGPRLRGLLGVVGRAAPGLPDLVYLGYDVAAPLQQQVGEGVFEAEYLWSTIGYLLWPQGAKKLLDALPVDQPVDNFVAWQVKTGQLRAFAAAPKLVEPEGAWDVNNDVQHSDEQSMLTRLAALGASVMQGFTGSGIAVGLPAWAALHGSWMKTTIFRTYEGASSLLSGTRNVTAASLLQL